MKCFCCNNEAKYSILLADGSYEENGCRIERMYLPNQMVRKTEKEHKLIKETWFCHECVRKIEDNLRATILYLQAENRIIIFNKE